jgi:hypothetical protein
MKTIRIALLGALLTTPLFAQATDQQIRAAYEVEIARNAFQAVLEMDPRHANARYQLGVLAQKGDQLNVRRRELALSKIMVPEVDFDGATVKDALDALAAIIERESGKKFAANFVVRDPSGSLAQREVTLKLRGVPANVVLKYICEQAGAISRIDEHVIVVQLPSGSARPVAAPVDPAVPVLPAVPAVPTPPQP